MQTTSRNHTDEKAGYPVNMPSPPIYTAWISISLILVISLMSLAGWFFSIDWLKSLGQTSAGMRIIVALCFLVTSASLLLINTRRHGRFEITIPVITGIFLTSIGLLTIYCWFFTMVYSNEAALSNWPVFSLFLSPNERMPVLSALIFLFTGIVLCLLAQNNHSYSNIAHILFILPTIAGYMIPVSYLLNGISIHQFFSSPVALNSGIAFCAVSFTVYILRPETIVMKVFTSKNSGV